jgi:hypothetical protein
LKRAAELQSGADSRGQLTLRDVEQIADAAGIESQYIRQAASALVRPAEPGFRVFGPPSGVQVTGGEQGVLNQSQLSDLLEEVRRVTGRQGVVHGVLDALEWRAAGALGATYVTVRQRADEVRVTVLSNRFDGKFTTYLMSGISGLLVGVGLAAFINDIVPLGTAGTVGVINASLLAGLAAGRSIWSATARHFRAQADRLFSTAVQHVRKVRDSTPP